MSEAIPEGGNDSGQTPAADEFTPITTQEEFNRATGDRVKRTEAKFADAVAKAAEFDKLQAANQTEAEKSAARIAELESALTGERSASQRLTIATANGITDAEDIELFLTGTDEETLTKQAKRLAERTADRKKSSNQVPREGTNPQSGQGDEMRGFTRDLFARANTD